MLERWLDITVCCMSNPYFTCYILTSYLYQELDGLT